MRQQVRPPAAAAGTTPEFPAAARRSGAGALPGGACSRRSVRRARTAPRRRSPLEGQALERRLGHRGRPAAREDAERRRAGCRGQPAEEPASAAPRGLDDAGAAGRRARHLADVLAHALQIPREVARRGVALVGVLGEAALDDPAQRRRSLRVDLRHRLRLVLDDRRQRLAPRVPLERALARRHLVEDRAERELVRAEVHRPARSPAPATCSRPCPSPCPGCVSCWIAVGAAVTCSGRRRRTASPGRSRAS